MRKIAITFRKKLLVTRDYDEMLAEVGERKIHAVGGTFDWVHRGHMALLAGIGRGKHSGIFLMALIPDDESVKKYKDSFPDVCDLDRGAALAFHPYIDGVFIHSDQPPCESIKRLNIVRLWKGIDYQDKKIPEMRALIELERETGVTREIAYCDHGKVYSCSEIRGKIARRGITE